MVLEVVNLYIKKYTIGRALVVMYIEGQVLQCYMHFGG